jgi:hypothetical protein
MIVEKWNGNSTLSAFVGIITILMFLGLWFLCYLLSGGFACSTTSLAT